MALRGCELVPEFEGLLELAVLAEDLGGALGVGEKLGIAHRFFQLGEAVAAFGDE
jgi:hypothetical protein